MLQLEKVTYRYAGALGPSLVDVALELGAGEIVGLIGAGEAGKTTLCLVASGLAPRSIGGTLHGRLLLDGRDARDLAMHEMAARIGIAFQNPATQLTGVSDTVFEEVAFGPANLGVPRDELIERTEQALATLRIESLAQRHPARLSGGQQQVVAIAGLLALRPRHLVLDEPTAQLDPAGTRLVADAIARLAAGGASILIAEQKTDVLRRLCRRVILLEHGRIALAGAAADVLASERLETAGVAWPPAVRLQRAARARNLAPDARRRLAAALRPETVTP